MEKQGVVRPGLKDRCNRRMIPYYSLLMMTGTLGLMLDYLWKHERGMLADMRMTTLLIVVLFLVFHSTREIRYRT